MGRAVKLAQDGPAGDLAKAVEASAPFLAWHDSSDDYVDHPEFGSFTRSFAYSPILGPADYEQESPLMDDRVYFGFSLQGPATFYPAHGHRALELYAVLGGTAAWWRRGEDWRRRPPGSFILHRPNQAHAMETFEEPLLSFFAWVSDLNSELWVGEG